MKIISYLFLCIGAYGLFYQGTLALFSKSTTSSSNTFAALDEFPTATSGPSPTPTPTPTTSYIATHVVISEVQINGGTGNADHDFIELYNPTNFPFDLNGHRLVRRTGSSSSDDNIKSWTSTTFIPAHGYYLWANNSDSDSPFISIADTTTGIGLTASSSVALRAGALNTGTLIDSISWNSGATIGEGSTFPSIPSANESIERKAYSTSTSASMSSGSDIDKGNGYDTNDNASDFVLQTSSNPQNSSSATEIP